MYPNVPTRRVGRDEFPTSVSFVNPKSATCIDVKNWLKCNYNKKLSNSPPDVRSGRNNLCTELFVYQYISWFNVPMNVNRDSMLMNIFKTSG